MRTSEIIAELESKQAQLAQHSLESLRLTREINHLSEQKKQSQLTHFLQYLQLGTIYTFPSFTWIKGSNLGVKESDRRSTIGFSQGDEIEWDRRNQKSIVVKLIKQHNHTHDYRNNTSTVTVTYPNTYFRLELESLFGYMMSDSQAKMGFDNYISRVEALEELGI